MKPFVRFHEDRYREFPVWSSVWLKPKKKTLPKNFKDLLVENDLETLKEVFETCSPDARGGTTKRTALAFNECPDTLARWLVERGADISAGDRYEESPLHARARHSQGRLEILLELGADVHRRDTRGNTPLHSAAAAYNAWTISVLLKHGADPTAVNNENQTPLSYALKRCGNTDIVGMAEIAEPLFGSSKALEKKGFSRSYLAPPKMMAQLSRRILRTPFFASAPTSSSIEAGSIQTIWTRQVLRSTGSIHSSMCRRCPGGQCMTANHRLLQRRDPTKSAIRSFGNCWCPQAAQQIRFRVKSSACRERSTMSSREMAGSTGTRTTRNWRTLSWSMRTQVFPFPRRHARKPVSSSKR